MSSDPESEIHFVLITQLSVEYVNMVLYYWLYKSNSTNWDEFVEFQNQNHDFSS